jgi:hypothetical protein
MNAIVEIRPAENVPGFMLNFGSVTLWFSSEVHAINHSQDFFPECDVVLYDQTGEVTHRYAGRSRDEGALPWER